MIFSAICLKIKYFFLVIEIDIIYYFLLFYKITILFKIFLFLLSIFNYCNYQ